MFLGYSIPRTYEAPQVTISKNVKYPLVKPTILKGFHVIAYILLNLKKIGFIDHDLQKLLELTLSRYMTSLRETEDGPIHLVQMEWEIGLEKLGLLSLMHMPHFGRTTEVNTCVKQVLVYLHQRFIWLDKKI